MNQNATTMHLPWTITFGLHTKCTHQFCRKFLFIFMKESVLSVFDNQVLKIKSSDLSDPSHIRQFKLQHLLIIQSVNNININSMFSKYK